MKQIDWDKPIEFVDGQKSPSLKIVKIYKSRMPLVVYEWDGYYDAVTFDSQGNLAECTFQSMMPRLEIQNVPPKRYYCAVFWSPKKQKHITNSIRFDSYETCHQHWSNANCFSHVACYEE